MTKTCEIDESTKERFFSKVNSNWEWTASTDTGGYGHMRVGKKPERAHRLSYRIHIGEIPKGMFVLHSCDNRICVNPDHLHLGTNADNMREKVERGRSHHPIGETNGRAVLSESDVISIIEKYKNGIPKKTLMKDYNIKSTQFRRIINRESWKHLEIVSKPMGDRI